MKEYYVAFFKNKNRFNPCSRLIEFVENIPYSHCEIVVIEDDKIDLACSYGSIFPASRKTSLENMTKHYEIERLLQLKTDIPDSRCDLLLRCLCNKPYSFLQIILAGIKVIAKGSISWLPGVKPNLSKYLICTEFAGIFMQEACGYRFEQSPELLTLGEVEHIAMNSFNEVSK